MKKALLLKRVYFPPTMMMVAFQQKSHILAESITGFEDNVGFEYEGGGVEEPMSPELNDLWDI